MVVTVLKSDFTFTCSPHPPEWPVQKVLFAEIGIRYFSPLTLAISEAHKQIKLFVMSRGGGSKRPPDFNK